MGYLYEACDQITDFCHQQLLRKMRLKGGSCCSFRSFCNRVLLIIVCPFSFGHCIVSGGMRQCAQIYLSGEGTAYHSGAPEFTPGFQWGSCYLILSCMCMFCRSLFVLLAFFFWSSCCLSFFDFHIGIFKLFLDCNHVYTMGKIQM